MCTFSSEHEKILENLRSLCSKLIKEHGMWEKESVTALSVCTVGDITRVQHQIAKISTGKLCIPQKTH